MNQGSSNKHKQQAQAAAGRAQPEVVFFFPIYPAPTPTTCQV